MEDNLTTGADSAEQKYSGGLKTIRTLESDIAEYTRNKNVSLLDIAAEEAKLRGVSFEDGEQLNSEALKKFKKIITVFLALLIIGGGGYLGFSKFLAKKQPNEKIALSQSRPGPILTNEEEEIFADISDKKQFRMELKNILEEGDDPLKLVRIMVVKNQENGKISVKRAEFAGLAEIKFPKELSDYLEDDFMLLRLDGRPILVFKAKSYPYVFSQMLKWEKSITKDLGGIFQESGSGGSFADNYIQNHDARVFYGQNGEMLAYSFIDRKYLVVADDEDSLAEMFRRFSLPQYANPAAVW